MLERSTYTVKRQTIERAIEVTGRATPVDMVRLAFRREGRVEHLFFQRGDTVKEGDVIAELQQTEAIDDLERAKVDLVQAKRDPVSYTHLDVYKRQEWQRRSRAGRTALLCDLESRR